MADKGSRFLLTLNNPTEATEAWASNWLENLHTKTNAVYTNGQIEKGAEGTTHIQAYISFKDPKRISSLKKVDAQMHISVVKKDNGASDYAMKEDTRLLGPWEFGKRPIKRNCAADWDLVRKSAEEGKFEDIPADIYVKHYQNLKRIRVDNIVTVDVEECRGVWIHGFPGCGKTTFARTEYCEAPFLYVKPQSKWWDGYKPEIHTHVVLDDIDTDCLAHYLKIWGDKWGCTGEYKGGTVPLNYQKFIVTSNFSIEELFKSKPRVTVDAILRRFQVVHMPGGIDPAQGAYIDKDGAFHHH